MTRALLIICVAMLAAIPVGTVADSRTLTLAYVNLADDPRHAAFRGYANIVLRPATDPYQGARTAMAESRVIGRALGIEFALRREQSGDATSAIEAIRELHDDGVHVFLVDLPGTMLARVAAATRELDILLFNVSAPDNALRASSCQPHLLHTYPSRAMLADALVQFAVSRNWSEVLVLQGPEPADEADVKAFQRSAERFGLDVTDIREFRHGNDPRERDRNDIELLTQGDYDAVYVADAQAGLGRHVPYRTRLPRPVLGSQGLTPDAWHWAAERYGAPQLNQRFEREAGRRMNGKDWAAWAAVRLVIDAVRATRSTDLAGLREFLLGDELDLDTYKGTPGSIRPWNGQLRQPVLLHTENAVIAYAPFEGFLHPAHDLDTLGVDRAETPCKPLSSE